MDYVRELLSQGKEVFLDLKLYDIAETVKRAVAQVAPTGVRFLTVHASGAVMRAAVEGRGDSSLQLLAVTVLTSLDENDLEKVGFRGTVRDEVLRLSALALANGCHGIVASAREASTLRAQLGQDFALVTPGVRPAGTGHGDQVRVVTPAEAIAAGASHIVVGRPITEAADPAAEARAILAQIGS